MSLADAALYRAKDAGRNRVEAALVHGADPEHVTDSKAAPVDGRPTVLPLKRTGAANRH